MTAIAGETERVREIWNRTAATYERAIGFETYLIGDARQWATAQADGCVLEIAIGTGLSLPHYAASVRVTGIDISAAMLEQAADRARRLNTRVDLRQGDAQRLDYPDAHFDTVVCVLSLCSIPDDRRAVDEAFRVLRPGGRFILVEHVRSNLRPVRRLQRLINTWTVRSMGDHQLRDPLDHLEPAGFEIQHAQRSRLGAIKRIIAVRH
jgi:ubiquinone/menaquinone biosynthesis C-methylase UbiE